MNGVMISSRKQLAKSLGVYLWQVRWLERKGRIKREIVTDQYGQKVCHYPPEEVEKARAIFESRNQLYLTDSPLGPKR